MANIDYKLMSECSFESYGQFPWWLLFDLRSRFALADTIFSSPASDVSQQDHSYLNGLHNILSNYISLIFNLLIHYGYFVAL